MHETLTITPHERVLIRRAEPSALEVEVVYGPGAPPPPGHSHPAQSERFEVLEGEVHARVGGRELRLGPGDRLDVPAGTEHQLWNAGAAPARAIWETRPAGRTLSWFRALDALQREGRVGRGGMPGPLAMGTLLTGYRDVFRLTARPRPLVRAALATLGLAGRLAGYGRYVAAATLAVAAVAALGQAPDASAAALGYEGRALVLRAAPGEENAVTLNATDDGRVAIAEIGAPLSYPAGPCSQANESMPVLCDVADVDELRFELGDGADRASVQDIAVSGGVITLSGGDGNDRLWGGPRAAATLDGGAGDDVITSMESADVLRGGPGADELIGAGGDDRLEGGDGDDVLKPDRYTTGNDLVDGGPGVDRLEDYSDPTKAPQAVSVTLDGVANDGRPGERDDVRDIEHVKTYAGGRFVMGDGPDRVEVFTPSDRGPATVETRGGDDVLLAGVGAQTLDGGAGADTIEGGFGDDVLTGGPGRDRIAADFTGSQCGWLQSCTLPHGNDVVHARDGEPDVIDCGVGEDKAIVDAVDTHANCEQVDNVGPGPKPDAREARMVVKRVPLRRALRRGLVVRLHDFPAGAVKVRALLGGRTIGTGRARVPGAGKATVRVRFSGSARRSLAKRSRVRMTLEAGPLRSTLLLRR